MDWSSPGNAQAGIVGAISFSFSVEICWRERNPPSAFHYLLAGVRAFPGAPQFADEIRIQSFVDIGVERLSFGIVAIHVACKPVAP